MNINNFNRYETLIKDFCRQLNNESNPDEVDFLTSRLELVLSEIDLAAIHGDFRGGGEPLVDKAYCLQTLSTTLLQKEQNIGNQQIKEHLRNVATRAGNRYQETFLGVQVNQPAQGSGRAASTGKTVGEKAVDNPKVAGKLTAKMIDDIVMYVKNHPDIIKGREAGAFIKLKKQDTGLARSFAIKVPEKGESIEKAPIFIFTKKKRVGPTGQEIKIGKAPEGKDKVKKDVVVIHDGKVAHPVADITVKKEKRSPEAIQELRKEFEMLKTFRDLPNVVQLVGAVEETPTWWEWMTWNPGKISDLLTLDYAGGKLSDAMQKMTTAQKKICISDVMRGVTAMHDKGYLHSNLTEENVLLDERMHGHVSGFGSTIKKGEMKKGGDRSYVSPECYAALLAQIQHKDNGKLMSELDEKIDSFSLGVVISHLYFGNYWTEEPAKICEAILNILRGEVNPSDVANLRIANIIGTDPTKYKSEVENYLKDHTIADIYRKFMPKNLPGREGALTQRLLNPDPHGRVTVADAHKIWGII